MTKTITIAGIDPGLATGGGVIITGSPRPEAILAVQSFGVGAKGYEYKQTGDPQFNSAAARARVVSSAITDFLLEWKPDLIGIESFVDLASRAKNRNKQGGQQFNQNRWMTPLVIGMVDARLQGVLKQTQLRYQNPAILSQYSSEIAQLTEANQQSRKGARQHDVFFPGDRLLVNDHLIKAWCHATWARDHFSSLIVE